VYKLAKSTHIHRWQPDYDYRLFIPPLFATNTHVCVFGLALIPCLQLISHDFIHVYSQEKLFNAFECKQASDESTQTPPKTHTQMTTTKGRNTFLFYSACLSPNWLSLICICLNDLLFIYLTIFDLFIRFLRFGKLKSVGNGGSSLEMLIPQQEHYFHIYHPRHFSLEH